jgi:transposase
LEALDFTDDRLALLLRALSDDGRWMAFEQALNPRLIRIYDLRVDRVRFDATTISSYRDVTDEGLFQLGHSKDHRPDLGQLKIMLATLDPLGMPWVTHVVPGNRADDPLYLPAIEAVLRSLDRTGLLLIGDCKMAALTTRATIWESGHYYLCPLSETQWSVEQQIADLTAVWKGEVELTTIRRTRTEEERF